MARTTDSGSVVIPLLTTSLTSLSKWFWVVHADDHGREQLVEARAVLLWLFLRGQQLDQAGLLLGDDSLTFTQATLS